MATPASEGTPKANDLDLVIADYLQAIENGEVPDRAALLQAHPSQSDQLRTFFADLDRMDRVAAPLRMEDNPTIDHTDESGAASPPKIRYFGDYELLEEVARGGMGIVYKARQTSLNRIVALKTVLQGAFATPKDVARFRTEAESAANLDHPNIVPIFEVGDHEGLQYFSMKFIEGTSLAGTKRGKIRDEVARLILVAKAVHYAHMRGILHRDLKPSNVLIDASGTPFVSDFGLAKRLSATDGSLTETGQFLGTPKYMAPEQASARKDLTLAADVYSLGVILYERLSGAPPFVGDDVLTILRQVRDVAPPPLSMSSPGMDRDLETITRKCLEKEPTARYQSAEDLADDLQRWSNGEPIAARPVSQAEKFRRWCKRNPALATAGGAAAVGLVMATIMSVAFALQFRARANAETKQREVAQTAERSMEGLLARGLVRPLNPREDRESALTEPESESLWELARIPDRHVGLRFLDEAVRNPLAITQLRCRTEPAMIAAFGLDESNRSMALAFSESVLNDRKANSMDKAELAFVMLELADHKSPVSDRCAETILEAMAENPKETMRREWFVLTRLRPDSMIPESIAGTNGLRNTGRLNPSLAARILDQALTFETNEYAQRTLCSAIVIAVEQNRVTPDDAAKILTKAMVRAGDGDSRFHLTDSLSSVISRMDPADAAKACVEPARLFTEALPQENQRRGRRLLADSLSSIAPWMATPDAARALTVLNEALRSEALRSKEDVDKFSFDDNPNARAALAGSLAKMATRIASTRATKLLAEALARETDADASENLLSGLSALVERMESREAERACAGMAQVLLEALTRPYRATRKNLAFGLSSLAARMDPHEAERVCTGAVKALYEVLARETDDDSAVNLGHDTSDLAYGMSELAQWMKQDEAQHACAMAAKKLAKSLVRMAGAKWEGGAGAGAGDRTSLMPGLSELAARMKPSEATQMLSEAIESLQGFSLDPLTLYEGLAASVGRLEPDEASRVCSQSANYLSNKMRRTTDIYGLCGLAPSLSTVTARMKPKEAALVCGPIAHMLSESMGRNSKNEDLRSYFAECLVAITKWLPPPDEAQLLLATLDYPIVDAQDCASLARRLAVVSSRMEPAESHQCCTKAAKLLIDHLTREKNFEARYEVAKALAAIAARMPMRNASSTVEGVTRHLLEHGRPKTDSETVDNLSAVDALTSAMPIATANAVGRELALWIAQDRTLRYGATSVRGEKLFRSCLSDSSREVREQLNQRFREAWATGDPWLIEMAATEPYPCRLSTPDLVELLKMPTVFGEARVVVLDHLGNRYGRKFTNHWQFVRYAKEHHLNLDFTTPPNRPDAKGLADRILKILDEADAK